MANQWLKRCCVGAMIAAVTVSSLPMQAFAEAGGVAYTGGDVSAQVSPDGKTVTIGNDAISRTFSITADNKLKTTEIDNKRANKKLAPAEGSEEFIIKRTKKDNTANNPIDQTGWTAKADSEEKQGESKEHHGFASNAIDNDPSTFWHSQYKDDATGQNLSQDNRPGYPHFMTVSLQKPTTFKSFSYDPRANGSNGNIKGYELYVSAEEKCPAIPDENAKPADPSAQEAAVENGEASGQAAGEGSAYKGWTKVSSGEFQYDQKNSGDPIHVNIEEENCKACENVRHVMLVATSAIKTGNDGKLAACEEFDLYPEHWDPAHTEPSMFLKSSDLTLADGQPTIENTSATINKQEKTGKKISFKFKPVQFNGVTYTITENIVAYNGDHYMRKYLEISVPKEDAFEAEIDYIDLESLDVTKSEGTWTIPTDKGGIVRCPKEKANLGQPFYADGMFFGCEFPATDTQIVKEGDKKIGRPRYYTGKTMDRLAKDGQAKRADDGTITYGTWQTVAGAARSTDYRVVQADFFDYIDDISVPAEFRIQYNSWYDDEKTITDQTILSSFAEIDRELSDAGLRPLDTYVVDDGWTNYHADSPDAFWEFDKSKFPNDFEPSSELVHNFGSEFGVWIGPRGGYGTDKIIAPILEKHGKGVVAGGSIDVADRTYLKHYLDLVCEFQNKYHVNYWKWDGFADDAQYGHYHEKYGSGDGKPVHTSGLPGAKTDGHMIGGVNDMYHVTDQWEAWTDLYEGARANAEKNGIPDYWISSTTYTHPSPWFLQWVNSVWLQCNFDHAGTTHGSTVHDGNLNARDACYYNFFEEHQFQFPLDHMYNHDPVYGKSGTGMNADTATAEGFQNYLYTIAGRGTAFWELYFSDSIFDTEKYEVSSEFLAWYEENFHLLSNARMFGGKNPVPGITLETSTKQTKPVKLANDGNNTFNTYGYAGFGGDEGILTVRNASADKAQDLKFTFDDATLGVKGANGETFEYVVERRHTQPGKTSTIDDKGTFKIGDEVTLNLQPEESLTIRVTKPGAGDKQGPSIEAVRHNGATEAGKTELIVRMDEKVKGDAAFTVNGKDVPADKVKRSADGVTFHITLDKAPEQGEKLDVKVSGITDMAGNALAGDTASVDFHEGNVVASRCPSRLTSYTKKLASKDASLSSKTGFTVFSHVNTTGHGPLVKQEGAYELGIDENGMPYIDVNGVRATGKVKVNDGNKHTIAGVRVNNGNLRIYVDGKGSGSVYDEKSIGFELPANDVLFAGGAFNKDADEASAKVYDRALGYDEIAKLHSKVTPNMQDRNLAKGKSVKVGWTVERSDQMGNNDMPFSNAVDGNKDSFSKYGEFGKDNVKESSYLQVDLGDVYEVGSVNLWRYWDQNREYNGTVVVLSEDDTFDSSDTIVHNSDKENKHGFGKGEESTYPENKDGKSFSAPQGTKARYARVYMHGSKSGDTNHVVELEVIGHDAPSKPGEQIDTSALYKRIDEVRAVIESGRWTPESVQKVMDKLEAAELVADCPKSAEEVAKALDELKGIEDLLKKVVTVSFAYKGDVPAGVETPAALDIEQGTALGDKLPVPTAEGYVFAGWFTDEACTAGNEFTAKTKVASDMTVFGKWVKDDGTVPPVQKPEQKPSPKPNKPGSNLPRTGDDSMLPIAVCGVAGIALAASALVIRKRRKA